jgi:hypothetical protein
MDPNLDKIDAAVLALLYLTSFTEGKGEFTVTRAWKSHDWSALDRLYQKGLVSILGGKRSENCLSGE